MRRTNSKGVRIDRYSEGDPTHGGSSPTDFRGVGGLTLDTSPSDHAAASSTGPRPAAAIEEQEEEQLQQAQQLQQVGDNHPHRQLSHRQAPAQQQQQQSTAAPRSRLQKRTPQQKQQHQPQHQPQHLQPERSDFSPATASPTSPSADKDDSSSIITASGGKDKKRNLRRLLGFGGGSRSAASPSSSSPGVANREVPSISSNSSTTGNSSRNNGSSSRRTGATAPNTSASTTASAANAATAPFGGSANTSANPAASTTTTTPSPTTAAGRFFGRTRPVSQQIFPVASSSTGRNDRNNGVSNSSNSSSSNNNKHSSSTSIGGSSSSGAGNRQHPTSQFREELNTTSASPSARERSSRPLPIAEESGVESRQPSNQGYRHSIAILPGFDFSSSSTILFPADNNEEEEEDEVDTTKTSTTTTTNISHLQQPLSPPSQQDSPLSPPYHTPTGDQSSVRAPFSVFNTSAAQSPDLDEHDDSAAAGSKASSSRWSGSRAPDDASPYQPYKGSYLYAGDDSRSSSRQSFTPSSPEQVHQRQPQQYLPYHSRLAVSQTSINTLDVSRNPSPLPQPPTLAREPSNTSQNQYGGTLDVDNSKKTASKAGGMGADGTPPPAKSKEDLASLDHSQLVSKHEELNEKYRKVKKYYFEKDAQVQNLQNTLAHQRLSQSRTSLDDNEYSSRFQRLDGAINNLAFNVRKDWRAVPPWLSPYVNNDAASNRTKEMTAVGRACISRWLVDEIFDRVFHPGLEPNLSSNLKIIERNLRRFAPPVNTDDERDTLLTKISNWRLSTLDGLSEALNSPNAVDYRTELTRGLVETLTSDLQMNLTNPPPPGLEAGVVGIIELAVGIAANLPLESRDVYVEYILPGVAYNEAYMKIEGNLPPLTNPGETYAIDGDPVTQGRRGSADEVMVEEMNPPIGGFVGAGPRTSKASGSGKKGDEEKEEVKKVRFAGFMSVMVKGKSMLTKAPVYV